MRVGKDQRRSGPIGLIIALALLFSACADGGGGDRVVFDASLNGADIAASEPRSPIELTDDVTAELALSVENITNAPLSVRYVRFEGEVLDMIFLTYDTALRVDLEAGEAREVPPILLDFFDLGGQASGYLRGYVQLYDEDRVVLGSQQVFLEASGDGFSTLEQFNVVLLVATVLGAAWNLLRLSQRRLPANRLVRGLRISAVGVGVALTLAVAFSTLRLWPLPTVTWVIFVIVGGLVGYLIGLILPGADDDLDDFDAEDLADALALQAAADQAPLTGLGARSTTIANED